MWAVRCLYICCKLCYPPWLRPNVPCITSKYLCRQYIRLQCCFFLGVQYIPVLLLSGQGSVAPPGTIAATPVQLPVTVEDGYPLDVPLVFFFGGSTPKQNPSLYKFQVERLAALLDRRANRHPAVAASGMFVNTMGWVEGLGYELILHSIQSLKVGTTPVCNNISCQRCCFSLSC